MNVSVLENITENIVGQLRTITTANGYANDASGVVRPNPGLGHDMQDNLLVVIVGNAEREWDCPEQYCQWLQEYHILCMVVESETSTTSIDARLNSIRADVESALCLQRESQTRGGLAEDTILQGAEIAHSDVLAHDGVVMVNVAVRYRTQYNNPYASIYDGATGVPTDGGFAGTYPEDRSGSFGGSL